MGNTATNDPEGSPRRAARRTDASQVPPRTRHGKNKKNLRATPERRPTRYLIRAVMTEVMRVGGLVAVVWPAGLPPVFPPTDLGWWLFRACGLVRGLELPRYRSTDAAASFEFMRLDVGEAGRVRAVASPRTLPPPLHASWVRFGRDCAFFMSRRSFLATVFSFLRLLRARPLAPPHLLPPRHNRERWREELERRKNYGGGEPAVRPKARHNGGRRRRG